MNTAPATTPTVFPSEPVRYTDRARWGWNNGFRRRWLANGARHAAVINAARRGDVEALRAHAATLGGLTQVGGWIKSAVALAAKLPADVPAYRVVDGRVCTPTLTWEFSGRSRRQVARLEGLPMW